MVRKLRRDEAKQGLFLNEQETITGRTEKKRTEKRSQRARTFASELGEEEAKLLEGNENRIFKAKKKMSPA